MKKVIETINSQDFYEVMYSYRHADMTNQDLVVERFEKVKNFIKEKVKEASLRDRFFLEEIVHRLKNKDMEYVETLSSDWLQEMVETYPLTEEERIAFISDVLGWDEDFCNSAYFKSEKKLQEFLNGE